MITSKFMAETTKTQRFIGFCSSWFRKMTSTKVRPWPQLPFVGGTGRQKKSAESWPQQSLLSIDKTDQNHGYFLRVVHSGAGSR